jgi:hypothetical protein
MKKSIIAITVATAILLSGCGTLSSMSDEERAQTRTLVIARCPILKQYSPERLKKAAEELKNLPEESELLSMLTDYGKMRDACRAITKELKKEK